MYGTFTFPCFDCFLQYAETNVKSLHTSSKQEKNERGSFVYDHSYIKRPNCTRNMYICFQVLGGNTNENSEPYSAGSSFLCSGQNRQ